MSDKKKEKGQDGKSKPELTSVKETSAPSIPDEKETVVIPGTPLAADALQALLGNNQELQNKVDFLTQRVEVLIAEKQTLFRAIDTITRLQAQIDQQRQQRQQEDAARAAQKKNQDGG